MKTITEDQFFEDFKPVRNHLDPNAAFEGCLFETYGEEKSHVHNTDQKKVWTVIEGDEFMFILSGMHLVNRLGFLITEKPYDEETEVIFD